MFNIGLGEILFISILVLVFIGPERLPKLMRQLGEYTAQVRGIIRSFNQEFAEELKPLYEIRNLADDLNPTRQLGNLLDPDVQRQAPKQTAAAKPKTNPMAEIGQSASAGALASQPANAQPPASVPQNTPANPMAQISQAMMAQSPDVSTQTVASTPSTPKTKTDATSPMASISQAMTTQNASTQSTNISDNMPTGASDKTSSSDVAPEA